MRALLGSKGMNDAECPTPVASNVKGRVSLPESVLDSSRAEDSLPPHAQKCLAGIWSHILRSESELLALGSAGGWPAPYKDPVLRHRRDPYTDLVLILRSRGLLNLTVRPRERAANTFVQRIA